MTKLVTIGMEHEWNSGGVIVQTIILFMLWVTTLLLVMVNPLFVPLAGVTVVAIFIPMLCESTFCWKVIRQGDEGRIKASERINGEWISYSYDVYPMRHTHRLALGWLREQWRWLRGRVVKNRNQRGL